MLDRIQRDQPKRPLIIDPESRCWCEDSWDVILVVQTGCFAAFFENAPQLQVVNSPLVTNALDTAALARLGQLTDLRLKAGSGCLQLDGGLKPLEGLAGTLTKLSLLTVTELTDTDYDVLGTLSNLEQGHNQFTKRVSLSNTNLNCIFGGG